MTYEVLARKWRPQVFEDVIGQEQITQTLMNAIKAGRLAHAYLFSGARGVGKTSVARIFAKAINCTQGEPGIPCGKCHSCKEITGGSSVDVQEIDGASNRGIDEIRELRENIKYMPSSSKFRLYIIDEVHMLTLPAFNALLKTLEEPPPHVKFIFATTESHKVPVTILSRCQRFDFKRIPLALIVKQMEKITSQEGIEISKSGLSLIAREAEGSMRDAESLLDQVVSFTGHKVEDKNITDILGIIDRALIFELSGAILQGSPRKCIEIVDQIYNHGYDIREFYRTLMDQFRDLLVSVIDPEGSLLDMIDTDRDELKHQAEMAGREKLHQCVTFLIQREESLRLSSHPKLVLETVLLKLCHLGEVLGFNEIMAKIEALETRLANVSAPDRSRSVGQLSDPASQWESKGAPEPSKEASPMSISMENWEAFQNSLSSENRSMASVLREWEFLGSLGDTIEIRRGKSSFSATYLDDPERLDKFLQSCSRFFGRPIQIKIVDGSAFGEENRAEIEKRPELKASELDAIPKPVQDILDVFQGEIKGEVPSRRRIIGKEGSSGMIRREKS